MGKKDLIMDKPKIKQRFDFYILLFFLLACAGWVWEVLLYLVTDHAFINRGLYHGPYLPIYGIGGILLYLVLNRVRSRPLLVFGGSLLLCSVLEYFGSWFLESLWGIRWWDYSGHFMNLNGRICLLGSLFFGIGGTLLLCLFLPLFEKIYGCMPVRLRVVLCLILLAIFVMDAAHAAVQPNVGRGITAFWRLLP